MAIEIRNYNANSQQRRYRIRHWIPIFLGHPVGNVVELRLQYYREKI